MKKLFKILLILIALITVLIVGMIIFSPYGYQDGHDYKVLKETVVINNSAEAVFDYLGNSDNAEDWSVFVDHITTVNGDEVPDGQVGSVRRCFEHADEETGVVWDEKTIISKRAVQRRLTCFNLQRFDMSTAFLMTDQLYVETGPNQCTLSFTLFIEPGKSTWFEDLKMYFAGYEVSRIFKDNLENIKKFAEEQ